ncbi:mitochondrial carrier domain-containing protein [Podospora aff. communis PSN243]|uniref:Mitochondrial carrier domain-containing protein n=1 Tax=Podospora aff. communis PSN243 TaxID=3040156 RepID=A0AAV9GB18_9PEZI|nr:mitochondrial carrier domain-containing protein [Podospora aff. communis PSN243]
MGSGDAASKEVLLAGAVAAFTVDVLVYPLDTIKTRYQSQGYIPQQDAKKALSRNPFKGLYQGIGSVVIATLPAAGVFFLTYETAKSAFGFALSSAVPQPAVHALASGCAELASCVVLTPAEVIKQNAQVLSESGPRAQRGHESTSLKALRMVWGSDGRVMRRMWAGYSALVARNLPFTALHFPMFEFFRGRLWDQRHRRKHALEEGRRTGSQPISGNWLQSGTGTTASDLIEVGAVTGLAAAASGSVAAFVTTPTDVVKTRMMLLGGDAGAEGAQDRQAKTGKSGFDVAKIVFRETGIRGLFRGAMFRIVWTALGSGLYLGSYEMAKSWLKGDPPPTGNAERVSA